MMIITCEKTGRLRDVGVRVDDSLETLFRREIGVVSGVRGEGAPPVQAGSTQGVAVSGKLGIVGKGVVPTADKRQLIKSRDPIRSSIPRDWSKKNFLYITPNFTKTTWQSPLAQLIL
jgi:hypothetical protein